MTEIQIMTNLTPTYDENSPIYVENDMDYVELCTKLCWLWIWFLAFMTEIFKVLMLKMRGKMTQYVDLSDGI